MGKDGSGFEKGRMLQCRKMRCRMVALQVNVVRWVRSRGYRGCRPSFTVGRRPIRAAGSMTCSISCVTATLIVAFSRVAGNRGARTPGVDGLTVADVEAAIGVPGFLDDLRAQLKAGMFRPLPVRERMISKPGGSGKVRRLGIPTVADRVIQ